MNTLFVLCNVIQPQFDTFLAHQAHIRVREIYPYTFFNDRNLKLLFQLGRNFHNFTVLTSCAAIKLCRFYVL